LYGSATYYLQLSVSEGFGNALCEAMLCGCIPIVSSTGAMPRIVGDTGYIVQRRDPDVLERTIREAMSQAAPRGPNAMRERIMTDLPLALRATGLPSIVLEVITSASRG
ncbi:MAG TPA: glycosyltransferase, partial [Flavobacteriales bacterium]|nr:glycosyltransferase [Flavobacteriales bacterium]